MTESPSGNPRSKNTRALQITALLRPYWKSLVLAFVAVVGETAADTLEPWPVKVVLDNVLQGRPLRGWLGRFVAWAFSSDARSTLDFAVAAVAVIAVVGAVSSYAEKWLTTSVSQWVGHDLRRLFYHHIQRLSFAEHDERQTGDLVSRVTDDIDSIQDFITSALLGILVDLLTLVGMIVVMLYLSWRFTLIALAIAPVLFTVVNVYTRRIKAASRAVRKKESELLSLVAEVLGSIRVVQAFVREDYEERRFLSGSLAKVEAGLEARNLKARLAPAVDLIVAAGTCLVLGTGARFVLAGEISPGVLVVFLLYLSKMYKPMRDLSKMTDTVSKAAVGYERIQEVLKIESQVRDLPKARRAPRFKGEIEFDRVTFAYDGETTVLKDVSFQIEPGQFAGLVGPSGTGKTTIASLIARFYDPTSGEVRIDGHDVRSYTLKSLRTQMSFVLQDTLLFRATIWDNIAYGNPNASRRAIIEAAERADAGEFIDKLPDGYQTMIGERGVTLSGGQRQRLAIARAIVRDTPILILDEPTTGLDAASARGVIDALERLMKGRTCIVIAHHLEAVRQADVIFVIRESELVEQGTHRALLAKHGLYSELHDLQERSDSSLSAVSTRR
jgi:ATP-binding cassette subfamily B protein